jgi:CubicO group peptidase (beta-lactamase class C family)
MKTIAYICTIAFLVFSCIEDENLKLKTIDYTPITTDDAWRVDSNYVKNYNADKFQEIADLIFDENKFLFVRSMIIIKDGKMIFEAYTQNRNDRYAAMQIWSETKSFVSILTGVAIDKKRIYSVRDSIFKYLPEYKKYADEKKLGIKIEDCLTMRSGIDYDNDGIEEDQIIAQEPNDLIRFMIERPLIHQPGTFTFYKNSDPQLISKVVSNAVGMDLVKYADSKLFKPLGIKNYYWSRNRDNTPYGGFGLWLSARDLAKFGQMILDNGVWRDNRIVSQAWIDSATTIRTSEYGYGYGYYFWSDQKQNKYIWCWGHAGQYIFISREKNAVLVINSDQFADKGGTSIEEAFTLADKAFGAISK